MLLKINIKYSFHRDLILSYKFEIKLLLVKMTPLKALSIHSLIEQRREKKDAYSLIDELFKLCRIILHVEKIEILYPLINFSQNTDENLPTQSAQRRHRRDLNELASL